MARIDSLANGIRLLEVVAEAGEPMATPALVFMCREFLSEASVKNAAETLVSVGWLQKVATPGGVTRWGLGKKAAMLWQVYLGRRISRLEEKQDDLQHEINECKQMADLGSLE